MLNEFEENFQRVIYKVGLWYSAGHFGLSITFRGGGRAYRGRKGLVCAPSHYNSVKGRPQREGEERVRAPLLCRFNNSNSYR